MRSYFVSCLSRAGFHRVRVIERGAAESPLAPVVCLHGLTRNARDFDLLAEDLSTDRLVLAVDVVGRGMSDWLRDPALYGYPQYIADLAAILARFEGRPVDVVGTSMGGLIGMLAAATEGSPLRRLVMNDVGPFIPKSALERIAAYVGLAPPFRDLDEAASWLARTLAGFGPLSPAEWRELAESSTVTGEDGTLTLAVDPAIGDQLRAAPLADVDLWAFWDRLAVPVLALRGAVSDLLLPETAGEMTRRGPGARIQEIPGCGHAPPLRSEAEIALIRDFLDSAGRADDH